MKNDLNIEEWGERTVGVVFRNTKYAQGYEQLYTYRAFLNMDIKKGDLAVVEKDGVYSFVTIVRIDEESKLSESAPYKYKWLCCIVERRQYDRRVKEENNLTKENAVKSL